MNNTTFNGYYKNQAAWTNDGAGLLTGHHTVEPHIDDARFEIHMFITGARYWIAFKDLRDAPTERLHGSRLAHERVAEDVMNMRDALARGSFPAFPNTADWEMPVVLITPWPRGLGEVKDRGSVIRPKDISKELLVVFHSQHESNTLGLALRWKIKDHAAMVERMEKVWIVPKLPWDFRPMDSDKPDDGGPSGYVHIVDGPGVLAALKNDVNKFSYKPYTRKGAPDLIIIGSIRLALGLYQMGFPLNKYPSTTRPSKISKRREEEASAVSQPAMSF